MTLYVCVCDININKYQQHMSTESYRETQGLHCTGSHSGHDICMYERDLPPAPAGDAGEGVRPSLWVSGGEGSSTVPVTGATAGPAPGTELARVETADGEGEGEDGQLETADSRTSASGTRTPSSRLMTQLIFSFV